jgi:hypothetical protein
MIGRLGRRHAVLTGVSQYSSPALHDLPAARKDLAALHRVLAAYGFTVQVHGQEYPLSRNDLFGELRQPCQLAKMGDTLLLYYTGHGIHFKGKDYLVPSDARLDDEEALEEYLVPVDLGGAIDRSKAETLIFMIDACREGVEIRHKSAILAGWTKVEQQIAENKGAIYIFGCSPGQVCLTLGKDHEITPAEKDKDGDGAGSVFTTALVTTLQNRQFGSGTIRNVVDATQEAMHQLAEIHRLRKQTLRVMWEEGAEGNLLTRLLFDTGGAIAASPTGVSGIRGVPPDPYLLTITHADSSLLSGDGVPIHCPTFAAVFARAGFDEGYLSHETQVARNTIRGCLGLDDRGPIAKIERVTFERLLNVLSKALGEKLDFSKFHCELDDKGTEIVGWDKALWRRLLGNHGRDYLDAALSRSPEVLQAIDNLDFAEALYAALCNNIWYRTDPKRVAWVCSWREASALIALLRGHGEPQMEFYAGGKEGFVRDDVGRLVHRVTGWNNASELMITMWAHTGRQRLTEIEQSTTALPVESAAMQQRSADAERLVGMAVNGWPLTSDDKDKNEEWFWKLVVAYDEKISRRTSRGQ